MPGLFGGRNDQNQRRFGKTPSVSQSMDSAIKKGGMGKLSFGGGPELKGGFMKKKSAPKILPERALKKGEMHLIIAAYFKGPAAARPSAKIRLLGLTARDLGEDRAAWDKFYEDNRGKEIRDWRVSGMLEAGVDVGALEGMPLVGALIEALRHERRPIREAAFMWLRELVGMQMPFVADVSKDLIETYYNQWKMWFEKEEKHAAAAKSKDEPKNP